MNCPHCNETITPTATIIGAKLNCGRCGAFLKIVVDHAGEPGLCVLCSWCDEPVPRPPRGNISTECSKAHKDAFFYWNYTKPAIEKARGIIHGKIYLTPIRLDSIFPSNKPA